MKKLTLIFLILYLSLTVKSQFECEYFNFKEFSWKDKELNLDDSTKKKIILSKHFSNKNYPYNQISWYVDKALNRYLSKFHPVNLNNDGLIDFIYTGDDGVANVVTLLKQTEKEWIVIFHEQGGKLTNIEFNELTGNRKIELLSFKNLYNSYIELNIINSEKELFVKKSEIFRFGETIFPSKFELRTPFIVKNEKYYLRHKPEISESNVIGEFTKGDYGVALASETDDTGRVWWFVIMYNNIPKEIDKFETLKMSEKEFINIHEKAMFGWISSRFLEEIK